MTGKNNIAINCENLSFSYENLPSKSGALGPLALNRINLSIYSGDFVCLAGPSGSGKTTLLQILGLIEPMGPNLHGTVELFGRNIRGLTDRDVDHLRLFDIGFIFQDFHLVDVLTVAENVGYFSARQGVAKTERTKIVEKCLFDVGLEGYGKRFPYQLSGGQKQRVAIARALAKQPKVIIADEPTANLDSATSQKIIEILDQMTIFHKVTTIVASHDPLVLQSAQGVVVMRDGRISEFPGSSYQNDRKGHHDAS